MSVETSTIPRWVVTTRTHGDVLTAGISAGDLELVLLGVPTGFTPAEVSGWLQDLAGVARETSATDLRVRAIPPLLHHSLTGLLFSHAELWHRAERPDPCSVAFVETVTGPAFGWVGEAQVSVLVDGEPVEPMWVRVRDEEGREARAFLFDGAQHVLVSLDHWPDGASDSAAPAAVEAEWLAQGAESAAAPQTPAPVANATPEAPAEEAAAVRPAAVASASVAEGVQASEPQRSVESLPEELPQQQPGLAQPVRAEQASVVESVQAEVVQASEPQAPVASVLETSVSENVVSEPVASESVASEPHASAEPLFTPEPEGTQVPEPERPHPVGNWLAKLMGWGKRAMNAPEREPLEEPLTEATVAPPTLAPESESTPIPDVRSYVAPSEATVASATPESQPLYGDQPAPLSAYDTLLSGSVPDEAAIAQSAAMPEALEQIAMELPPEEAELMAEAHSETSAVVSEPAPVPAPPTPAPTPIVSTLRPVSLSDILGARASASAAAPAPEVAPPAPAPAPPAPEPASRESMAHVDPATLPVLAPTLPPSVDANAPIAVDHEPVGAADTFAIAPVPKPPASSQPPAPPAAPVGPPVLKVTLPPQSIAAAPLAPAPLAPAPIVAPAHEPALAPPVLKLPEPKPLAPPVLRVQVAPNAPPVIGVAPRFAPADAPAPEFELTPSATERALPPIAPRPITARNAWPSLQELEAPSVWYAKPWVWGAVTVLLFAVGWLLGGIQNTDKDQPSAFAKFARAIGLGGARYVANIDSDPQGAWIAIDGKDMAKRTPASLELAPGEHIVTLTLPDLGSAKFPLKGKKDEKVAFDQSLNGSLEIQSADAGIPISVAVDGKPQGYAPVRLESIAPGLHEVQFSGPGMPAWAQTIQVGVRTPAQLVAHPMSAPANGVIQVQAMLNDEQGASALSGAQVFVDGELKGVTPTSLDLPRGPHSLRVAWRGTSAPVQVIDLPGGNQRFATFNFGLDIESPRVNLLQPPRVFPADQTTLVSAQLDLLKPGDVRESWLHVRAPEGLWRRYPMNLMQGPSGTVVACVFPVSAFDSQGNTRWYVSSTTTQGDEIFSEILTASLAAHRTPAAAAAVPVHRPRPATPAPETTKTP